MSALIEKAALFRALHVAGRPLVLFNAWDAGSAKAIAAGGAHAIATGSWAVAAAHGFADGEAMPLALALANLERIAGAVDLPVSIDLESGYGASPQDVANTVARAFAAGAIGCNLEDSYPENGRLRAIAEQVERIRAAAQQADFFINARTDLFLIADAAEHTDALVDAAIERAHAYAQAGASGFFAPGLADAGKMARLAAAIPLPLNIMVTEKTPPLRQMAEAGVARVSHGGGPYRLAMRQLEAATRAAMA